MDGCITSFIVIILLGILFGLISMIASFFIEYWKVILILLLIGLGMALLTKIILQIVNNNKRKRRLLVLEPNIQKLKNQGAYIYIEKFISSLTMKYDAKEIDKE